MAQQKVPHFETEVVVVGGGIAGCATAYELARAGVQTTLLERGDLNAQASGRNAGSLHGQIQHHPFAQLGEQWAREFLPALRFMNDSLRRWDDLSAELGVDLEVSRKGGLLVAADEEQLAQVRRKAAVEAEAGLPVEIWSRAELAERAPYLSHRMAGAEYVPDEGKANPLLAAPAFAAAARAAGARILTGTPMLRLRPLRPGFEVQAPAGTIRCRTVVATAGADLSRISAQFGPALPITDEPVQVHATEPVVPTIPHLVYFAGGPLTLKQARAGSILIGGGWPALVRPDGRPVVSPDSLRGNLAIATSVMPSLGSIRLIRSWTGTGNGTPDQRPIIGTLPGSGGLILGMFPYMGLTTGPLLGRVLARLVQGGDPGRDLSPFDPARF